MNPAMLELPERYRVPWEAISTTATRKRLRLEIRFRDGTPEPSVGEDGILRGAFELYGMERGAPDLEKIGAAATFDQAIASLATWLEDKPLPGPDALREELRRFGQRLALLTPRDLAKKRGADVPIYRDFRDRILPLAWDNLVESVRVEALEDFVRRVGALSIAGTSDDQAVRDLAAEARGLVAPKDGAT